jgi:general secretion pathway protein G
MAVASLVLGILGITALVGLILGIVSLVQANRSRGRLGGQGLAIAGICVSAFMLVAILPAMLFPVFMRARSSALRVRAMTDIRALGVAIDLYAADNGAPPTTMQGLEALQARPTVPPVPMNWNGPYIKTQQISRDPWGNPYHYACPGELNQDGYDIISYGADGRPGGFGLSDEDISNADFAGELSPGGYRYRGYR